MTNDTIITVIAFKNPMNDPIDINKNSKTGAKINIDLITISFICFILFNYITFSLCFLGVLT